VLATIQSSRFAGWRGGPRRRRRRRPRPHGKDDQRDTPSMTSAPPTSCPIATQSKNDSLAPTSISAATPGEPSAFIRTTDQSPPRTFEVMVWLPGSEPTPPGSSGRSAVAAAHRPQLDGTRRGTDHVDRAHDLEPAPVGVERSNQLAEAQGQHAPASGPLPALCQRSTARGTNRHLEHRHSLSRTGNRRSGRYLPGGRGWIKTKNREYLRCGVEREGGAGPHGLRVRSFDCKGRRRREIAAVWPAHRQMLLSRCYFDESIDFRCRLRERESPGFRGFLEMERTGIEPVTSGLQSRRSPS
jgi:hypothetical protein